MTDTAIMGLLLFFCGILIGAGLTATWYRKRFEFLANILKTRVNVQARRN